MPTELRPCFMYLSLFPKDYPLRPLAVIQQWMANGFLEAKGQKMEEDIGTEYFNELVHRSLLQVDNNNIKNEFVMHDLIHDLAQDVARAEYLLISAGALCKIPKTIRHLSVLVKENSEIEELKPLFESKLRLRTLMLHSVRGYPMNSLMPKLMHNLSSLRTLSFLALIYHEMYASPIMNEVIDLDFVGTLKHLRYLGLSPHTSIRRDLSESVCKLYHLQTLDLGRKVVDLSRPNGIGDLVNIRHFFGNSYCGLPHEVIGLTNLQTMREFTVGAGTAQCKVRHLKGLVNLRGYVRVLGLDAVDPSDLAPATAILKTRTGIVDMDLCWYRDLKEVAEVVDCDEALAEQVLDCLQPQPRIRGFGIDGYPGATMPVWLGSLSKLESLTLERCRIISLPTLGQLPSLRLLQIKRTKTVKIVGREFLCSSAPAAAAAAKKRSCFPLLQKLAFVQMEEWEEWHGVEEGSDFPILRQLQMYHCPKLRRLPSLPSLEVLKICSSPELMPPPSLPSLAKLNLNKEWNPDVLSVGCTPTLQRLVISFYRGDCLVFPADNQGLRSLQELSIGSSSELRSVEGLCNLASLCSLLINRCPNLHISPDERLPPDLQDVSISESPGAENWHRHQVEMAVRCPTLTNDESSCVW